MEEISKDLIEQLGAIVYRAEERDGRWVPTYFASGIEKLTGLSSKEFVVKGYDWKLIIHPSDLVEVLREGRTIPKKIVIRELKYRMRHKSGKISWVRDVRRIDNSGKNIIIEGLLFDITPTQHIENRNTELVERLTIQNKELEDLNHAFKTVISSVEKEKQQIRDNIHLHIENNITPILVSMRKKGASAEGLLKKLEFQLGNVLGMSHRKIFLIHNRLSPKEIEICYAIVQGLKGKEIASQLSVSYLTLRTHTKNIRKKLALKREQNLRNFLEEILYDQRKQDIKN